MNVKKRSKFENKQKFYHQQDIYLDKCAIFLHISSVTQTQSSQETKSLWHILILCDILSSVYSVTLFKGQHVRQIQPFDTLSLKHWLEWKELRQIPDQHCHCSNNRHIQHLMSPFKSVLKQTERILFYIIINGGWWTKHLTWRLLARI